MLIEGKKISKQIEVSDGKIESVVLTNKLTGKTLTYGKNSKEFIIYYRAGKKKLFKDNLVIMSSDDMTISEENDNTLVFHKIDNELEWTVTVSYDIDPKSGAIKKYLNVHCSNEDIVLDRIDLERVQLPANCFRWSIPQPKEMVYVPAKIMTMGQPIYFQDFFAGGEFCMAENNIYNGYTTATYYYGRSFKELCDGSDLTTVTYVVGAGRKDDFNVMRADFFEYVSTFARQAKFRVQYNSWYDYMLDIDSEKITSSFIKIADGFKKADYRPLDCYVVDDGWTNYKESKFWEFNSKFPNEFNKESELTKELNSTFGVWFGPRGGYTTQTVKYAKLLEKIGYFKNWRSQDICTGDPRYIADLCKKMADFCLKYNVEYYKIDGFAKKPCSAKHHGHPVGKGNGEYFYTFLWEEWLKGFAEIRKACPDVFLNITSYAHCSPWFLSMCDAIWINNSSDMGFNGKGSNLDQCLNYRDGRYCDFYETRQIQFPNAYVYNHEPCYAERNVNVSLPAIKRETIVYTDEEFERYLTMCMMRGTCFVELYLSPSMLDDNKYKILAKVLKWTEDNIDIIKNSQYFGDDPKKGCIYGYYAYNDGQAIMAIRNSDDKPRSYALDNAKLSHTQGGYSISQFYPTQEKVEKVATGKEYNINLKPFEMRLYKIELDK